MERIAFKAGFYPAKIFTLEDRKILVTIEITVALKLCTGTICFSWGEKIISCPSKKKTFLVIEITVASGLYADAIYITFMHEGKVGCKSYIKR